MKKVILFLVSALFIVACGSDNSSESAQKIQKEVSKTEKILDKKIFLIGPSTVYIQKEINEALHYSDDSECPLYGWGELLSEYTKDSQGVYNYAQPGASAKTFKIPPEQREANEQVLFGPNRDHYWTPTKKKMQEIGEGILLIQFGGNDYRHLYQDEFPLHVDNNRSKPIVDYDHDGKGDENDRVTRELLVKNAFKENIKFYIDEARGLNFTPILVTTPSGRDRDEGSTKLKYSREPFPTYMKELAKSENIRVLDLNRKTIEVYESYSDEELHKRFADCYNRWGKNRENVHYEKHGARVVAGWIKELACEDSSSELCQQFK